MKEAGVRRKITVLTVQQADEDKAAPIVLKRACQVLARFLHNWFLEKGIQ